MARSKRAVAQSKKRKAKPSLSIDELTHIDHRGEARMVDVSGKNATERMAVAEGKVVMRTQTLDLVLAGNAMKGDVLGAARLAGIMAAKRTHGLIPLCHPLPITKVEVEINPEHALPGFLVQATVKVTGQTGVEMEALTAVSIACLTIYDMVKAIEKGYPQKEIAEASYQFQRATEAKEKVTVGANEFVVEEPPPNILYIGEEVAEAQTKKLNSLRQRRSNDEVRRTLDALKKAAAQEPQTPTDGKISPVNTMPFIVDAVKAYATVGEICDALREVYGTYEESAFA